MSDFLGKLKETLQDAGWFVGAPVAAAFDMAKSAVGASDQNMGQIVSTAFNRGTQLFFGDTQGTEDKTDDTHNLVDPLVGKLMDGIDWVYDNAIAQPINTANITEQRIVAGLTGTEDNAHPWDFKSAWNRADETKGGYGGTGTSIGRESAYTWDALVGLVTGNRGSLTDDGQQVLDQQSKLFDVQSGLADATASFFLDPTIVLGKVSKALKVAKVIDGVSDTADLERKLNQGGDGLLAGFGARHDSAMDFIAAPRADGASRSAGEIYHAFDGLKDSNDGMLIASLMESTVKDMRAADKSIPEIKQQVALISRAGMGDANALKGIDKSASAAKDALASFNSNRDELAKAQEYALVRNGKPLGYVSPYAGQRGAQATGLAAAQNVATKYNFAQDVASRGVDYFSSDEFLTLADARMNAVAQNFTAAEREAARMEKLAQQFHGDDTLALSLKDKPLLAALNRGGTRGLEKRAEEFSGVHTPTGTDFIFQSSAWNYGVKLARPVLKYGAPHVFLAGKAFGAFKSPVAPRLIEFHDPHVALALNAFLRHSALDPKSREGLVSEMAAAKDESAMRAVTTRAVTAAQQSMVDAYKVSNPRFTDETAQIVKNEMAKQIAWERDRVSNMVRKFTAHKSPDGAPGDVRFDPETGLASYHALLETQLENRMVLPDLKTFDRVLSRHANVLTDMANWAKGNRLPDQGAIKDIAGRVFDTEVKGASVNKVVAPVAQNLNLATWKTDRFVMDALARFNSAWKFAALFRPAYPMRVLVDSDLRVLAKVGPAAFAMHVMPRAFGFATVGGASRMKQLFAQRNDDDELAMLEARIEDFEGNWRAKSDAPIDDPLYSEMLQDKKTIEERQKLAATGRDGRREAYGVFGEAGQKSIKTAAGEIMGAFGDTYGKMRRWQYSSETTANLVGDSRKLSMRNLLSENWTTLDHTAENHMDSWLQAINAQLLQSQLGKKALEFQLDAGDNPAKAALKLKEWANRTPEGRELMGRLMWTGASADHAAEVVGYVNHYLPTPELRAAARGRRIKQEDLEAAFPDPTLRPPVHGQALKMSLGRGSYSGKVMNNFMSRTMQWLSDAPEDQLARHPLYAAVYEQEAKRQAEYLMANPEITHVTGADIKNLVMNKAHKAAGHAVKQTMFDIATRSDLSEAFRFVSPFIAAWEDTLKKWGKLAADNPQIVGQGLQLWNIPTGLGLVVDQDGHPVKDKQLFTDKNYILMQWPSWVPKVGGKQIDLLPGTSLKKLTGGMIDADGTNFSIPTETLNIVLQGGLQPGFGPLVSYPVSKLQMAQPDIDDVAKIVNPYGPQSLFQTLAPATIKRLADATNAQSTAHLYDTERMFMQMQTDYRLDPEKYGAAPTWAEAAKRANAVGRLKILNNFANPFPFTFDSKFKLYVDGYRDLKNEERIGNHEQGWADTQFINTYGQTYFPLVQSMSKNNAGLAATAESVNASKKYSKLIDQYGTENGDPNSDLIRLIVGPEQEGDYNETAHRWQQVKEISAGSGQTFRTVKSPQAAAAQADSNLGWYKYRQFMNTINAQANQQGYKTYQESNDLVDTRKQFIANLGSELPAWRVDWDQMDSGKFERNVEKLGNIVQSDKFPVDRTDISGTREYLALRTALKDKLANLDIGENTQAAAPLRQEFTNAVMDLVSQNTSFSEWAYAGFLERDPLLDKETVQAAQAAQGVTNEWGL